MKLNQEQIEDKVLEAQNGDMDAFASLYDNFVDPIYKYLYFKVGKQDALDLTENVFLKVWENLKSYKKGSANFSAWIFRIAHNLVVDHYRSSKENLELTVDIVDNKLHNDPVTIAERKMSSQTLKKAISKLSKKHQQLILLKYINELENNEIAAVMGQSEGSLRILKFRALKALKEILKDMNVHY